MIKITTILALVVAMTTLQPIMAEGTTSYSFNGELDLSQYCTGILSNPPNTQQQFSGVGQVLQTACQFQYTYMNNMLNSIVLNHKNSVDGIKNTMETTKNRVSDINQKLQESNTAHIQTNMKYDNKLSKLEDKITQLQNELSAVKATKPVCAKENQISSVGGDWSHFTTIVVVGLIVAMVYYNPNFLLYIFKYIRKSFADQEKVKTKKIVADTRLKVNAEHQKALDRAASELKSTQEALTTAQQNILAEEEKASNARKEFQALEAQHSREELARVDKEKEFEKALVTMQKKIEVADFNAMSAQSHVQEYMVMLKAAQSAEEATSIAEKVKVAQQTQVSQKHEAADVKQKLEAVEQAKALETKQDSEQTAKLNAAFEAAQKLEDSVLAAKAEEEKVAQEARQQEAILEQFKQKLMKELSTASPPTVNNLSTGQISPEPLEVDSDVMASSFRLWPGVMRSKGQCLAVKCDGLIVRP